VLHHCDNRACVRPEHLYAGTQKDNNRDAKERGRFNPARGERSGKAKLTEADVVLIAKSISARVTLSKLAEEYGVTSHAIRSIKVRRTWRHVERP